MKLFLFRKVKFVLKVVGGWQLWEAWLVKTCETSPILLCLASGSQVWASRLQSSISNVLLKSLGSPRILQKWEWPFFVYITHCYLLLVFSSINAGATPILHKGDDRIRLFFFSHRWPQKWKPKAREANKLNPQISKQKQNPQIKGNYKLPAIYSQRPTQSLDVGLEKDCMLICHSGISICFVAFLSGIYISISSLSFVHAF